MTIPQKTFQQFVGDMTNSWGTSAGVTPFLSPGDFLLAIFEAVSGQLEFLQAEIQLVLALTRATTSTGADLDTWMADFSFTRLPATFATGPVVLGKNLAASSPIPVPAATLVSGVYQGGTLVQTVGGAIVFQVVPDPLESAYDPVSNNYILPAGQTSMTVTVQAVVAGSGSNVSAEQITQLGSQQAGIDTVNNVVPISNGVSAESDAAFRSRFVLYLSTLAKATRAAILAAAMGVQQGLQIALVENQTPTGSAQLGAFTVFVDNGTGAPPASLIASVYAAVDVTRAFGIVPYVSGPVISNAAIVLAVRVAAGYTLGGLQPLVQSAIAAVTNALVAGQTLFVSAVEAAALSVAGVVSVQPGFTTIDGVQADLVPSAIAEVRTNTSLITVGSY